MWSCMDMKISRFNVGWDMIHDDMHVMIIARIVLRT